MDGEVKNVFPLWPNRETLHIHDVHHVLSGYSTSVEGEFQIAAWGLGSGGCGINIIFWLDRMATALLGMFSYRKSTTTALKHGFECRNLYGRKLESLLDRDVEALKSEMQLHLIRF